ncbi:MAG: RHS repeat-associated core domain-containing protein [Treponema sp.]|uniref:RHS repeat domain-containing protein n=1 Tax=Treponema sp. TaxID=166 RepID=UPI001DDB301E|nr:RHS repeat-associated core domain-containing protein [Treponema sp.]MBS7309628.1 RHS repeat-associated core domain-containing protein [Treponema sp.]
MWTLHIDNGNSVYGGQYAKNVYLGETRIVTKLARADQKTAHEETYKQYYYHSDHLGSATMISDWEGKEYQRIEYTPYGETWVEKTNNSGSEFLPYRFTGKEVDQETGLYYYGARYLDPKYSMWISTDPALGEYVPEMGKGNAKDSGSLPGMGGVYNHINGNLFAYAANNPVRYIDPDGRKGLPYECQLIMRDKPQTQVTLDKIAYWSNSNPTFSAHVKANTSIEITRSVNDDGKNGRYYESTISINYDSKSVFSSGVQSTADNIEFVNAGKGSTLPAGEYKKSEIWTSSTSYSRAIRLVEAYLIHPNAYTASGSTTEWARPFSGGCQILQLKDFNSLILTLDKLGFKPGAPPTDGKFTGDTIDIKINGPAIKKNWAMIDRESMEK